MKIGEAQELLTSEYIKWIQEEERVTEISIMIINLGNVFEASRSSHIAPFHMCCAAGSPQAGPLRVRMERQGCGYGNNWP